MYTLTFKNGWHYYSTIGLAVLGAINVATSLVILVTIPFIMMTVK